MNQEKIGKFIREIRKKNNLTQNDLAEKLGVTYQAVSKWENGKNIPDISLLKEISRIFNVDINEILEGEEKEEKNNINRKKIVYIIILLVVIILGIIILIYFSHDHDFEFKTLTSSCDEFKLSGSIAYNKDKTSIYISNVNYCGEEENIEYDKIECTLYEQHNNTKTKISSCTSSVSKVSLSKYLENVNLGVDDYSASCKMFTSSNIYLEINATIDNKTTTYNVPITLNDNCLK